MKMIFSIFVLSTLFMIPQQAQALACIFWNAAGDLDCVTKSCPPSNPCTCNGTAMKGKCEDHGYSVGNLNLPNTPPRPRIKSIMHKNTIGKNKKINKNKKYIEMKNGVISSQ